MLTLKAEIVRYSLLKLELISVNTVCEDQDNAMCLCKTCHVIDQVINCSLNINTNLIFKIIRTFD